MTIPKKKIAEAAKALGFVEPLPRMNTWEPDGFDGWLCAVRYTDTTNNRSNQL